MENKFGVKEPIDLYVYSKDGLEFKITTSSGHSIKRENGENTFEITDALVDINVFQDILNGKYENKYLRLVGKTFYRDMSMKDRAVTITFTVAKLVEYNFSFNNEEVIMPVLSFSFPSVDAYGFTNLKVELDGGVTFG